MLTQDLRIRYGDVRWTFYPAGGYEREYLNRNFMTPQWIIDDEDDNEEWDAENERAEIAARAFGWIPAYELRTHFDAERMNAADKIGSYGSPQKFCNTTSKVKSVE